MSQDNPEWIAYQHRRWTRPNGDLYLRPDPRNYVRSDPNLYLPPQPCESKNSPTLHYKPVRNPGARRWPDSSDIGADRSNAAAIESELADLRYELALLRYERLQRKFNVDQLRVPAGNPDGGQWTPVAGPGGGGSRAPIRGQFPGATLRQEAELQSAKVRADGAIRAVRGIDPNWQPTPSFNSRQSIGGAISAERETALEAEARLNVLSQLGVGSAGAQGEANAQPLGDILRPGGRAVGVQESGSTYVRTVPSAEFDQIRDQMIRGAQPVLTPNTYNGLWFERPDGTRFGLRLSAESGPTIDIFKSNDPLIRENFKVHRR